MGVRGDNVWVECLLSVLGGRLFGGLFGGDLGELGLSGLAFGKALGWDPHVHGVAPVWLWVGSIARLRCRGLSIACVFAGSHAFVDLSVLPSFAEFLQMGAAVGDDRGLVLLGRASSTAALLFHF